MVRRFGAPKRQKGKADSFTAAKRQRFLDALALTCNVRAAAVHAGVDSTTVYRHRQNDAVFAGQWEDALQVARDRLEALMLQHGGAALPLEPADGERAAAAGVAAPFDLDAALKVLGYYLKKRDVGPNRDKPRKGASRDETNAVLAKALAAARRRTERIGA